MSLYPENLLPKIEKSAISEIRIVFGTLNNALSRSVELSESLTSSINSINGQLSRLFPEVGSNNINALSNDYYLQHNEAGNKHKEPPIAATDLSKPGQNLLNGVAYFGELPSQLKTLKSVLAIFTEASESVSKATELLPGTAAGASVAGAIVTSGEIAAGAVNTADAVAALGPPILVPEAGLQVSDNESQLRYTTNFTTDKIKDFYWNEEQEKNRKRLYHTPGNKHAAEVAAELNSGYMVEDSARSVQMLTDDRLLSEYDSSDPNKKILAHNSELAEWGGPITKNEAPQYAMHPFAKENLSEIPFFRFTPPIVKKLQEDIPPAKREDTLPYLLPTEKGVENYQQKEVDLPTTPGINTIPIKKRSETAMPQRAGTGIGNVVNINLNRPMIEHFTINAGSTKEGLSDFKYKVEEILLEILNSANVI